MNGKHRESLVLKSLSLLSTRDQWKILYIVVIQITLAFLDLLSIALIGLIASISLFGVQSRELPSGLQQVVEILGLSTLDFQSQVAILGGIAGISLTLKTLFSAYISRRILYFLNQRTAVVTAHLLARVLNQPFDYLKTKQSTETLYSLTRGVSSLVTGILGSLGQIITEISLIAIVSIGLVLFDPIITFLCVSYFGILAFIQTKRLRRIAEWSQGESTKALVKSENQILESLNLYRELHVRDARFPQLENLILTRLQMAEFNSRVVFMPYITKYTVEVALVLGAVILVASQILMKDALSAITTLSVFLVAATRVTPSLLRLQQSLIQFKASAGESNKTLALMKELEEFESVPTPAEGVADRLVGEIIVKDLFFKYRDGDDYVVKNLNLQISAGETVALVGPSGNGKSTIMDLLLGALLPSSGSIKVDGLTPSQFVRRFPGKIGYVSQESVFTNATIKDNLLLGLEKGFMDDLNIWALLDRVGLRDVVSSMPEGLNSSVGERGLILSSGQRQRLSLARALITSPKLLFLDEPTSSLDLESEYLITELIKSLHGEATIVVIAHRLETIVNADRIVSIVGGQIQTIGTYQEIFGHI